MKKGLKSLHVKQSKKSTSPDIKKIIFILTDTLRAKNIGLYGCTPSPTPHLDQLGKESIVFSNAYSSITSTDPSITSIMTGKYPLRVGLINHGVHASLPEQQNVNESTLLAEVLRKNGFTTAAVDWLFRWHTRGYDYYSGKILKDTDPSYPIVNRLPFPLLIRVADKIGIKYLNREFLIRFYYAFFPKPTIPYDPADVIVNEAIKLLSRYKKDKLFLYLHFWDAHAPHTRPRGLRSYITDNVEDTYNAEIHFIDEQVGRLIQYLKKTNQFDDTLLVWTSDHGENLHEHDIPFNHENLYDDVVKVPFVLSHPSLSAQKINTPIQQVNIFPTLLDLCGIKYSGDIDGESLLPLINGHKKSQKPLYFEDLSHRKIRIPRQTRRRGVRLGKYKYIQTLVGKKEDLYAIVPSENLILVREELFDLEKDPRELRNIIKEKKLRVMQLRNYLQEYTVLLTRKRLIKRKSLNEKVKKSTEIIRQTLTKFDPAEVAIAWTGGKDSTVLLHLVRLAFNGKVPFKILFNDSTMEFDEIYEFINKVSKLWSLNVITVKHSEEELKEFNTTKDHDRKKELSRLMKITAINKAVKKYKLQALMAGIRWDEHESRSHETYFSKRKDHVRVHPILQFNEKDIWEYIHFFGVPYVQLYDEGYRSLGEKPFTSVAKAGEGERSGRDYDKEQVMQRLRKLGYW